jgi:hypothetical protein
MSTDTLAFLTGWKEILEMIENLFLSSFVHTNLVNTIILLSLSFRHFIK